MPVESFLSNLMLKLLIIYSIRLRYKIFIVRINGMNTLSFNIGAKFLFMLLSNFFGTVCDAREK